ncbi:MAG: DUF2809 domain-containing protein [Janthinobacterium lividum]
MTTRLAAMPPVPRHRIVHLLYVLAVIALGLLSRRYAFVFPTRFAKYPGDALYALMMFFGWGMLLPALSSRRIALLALGTSFAVEFSQLYRAPWIDAIRAHPLGHLVLGSGFSPRDLLAYIVGTTVGYGFERLVRGWRKSPVAGGRH